MGNLTFYLQLSQPINHKGYITDAIGPFRSSADAAEYAAKHDAEYNAKGIARLIVRCMVTP